MDKAKFEHKKGSDGKHYWHLRAAGATEGNEIIATGEGYSSHDAAVDGVEAVKRGVLSSLGIDPRRHLAMAATTITDAGGGELTVDSPDLEHYVAIDDPSDLPL